jgi:hypothetical protein
MVKASQGYREKEREKSLSNRFSLLLFDKDWTPGNADQDGKQKTEPPCAVIQTIHFAVNDYASIPSGTKLKQKTKPATASNTRQLSGNKGKCKCDVEKIFGRKKF